MPFTRKNRKTVQPEPERMDIKPPSGCTPVTRNELATLLGVDVNTVTSWKNQGMPYIDTSRAAQVQRSNRIRFIFERCVEWLERRTQDSL